jgi:hypothetical protein
MSFEVVTTEFFERNFKKLLKKYPSLKNDLRDVIIILRNTPTLGQALGKDCFKVRISIKSKGKGKSGGGRLITCFKVSGNSVFLIALYDKSEMESLADIELDELLKRAELF